MSGLDWIPHSTQAAEVLISQAGYKIDTIAPISFAELAPYLIKGDFQKPYTAMLATAGEETFFAVQAINRFGIPQTPTNSEARAGPEDTPPVTHDTPPATHDMTKRPPMMPPAKRPFPVKLR